MENMIRQRICVILLHLFVYATIGCDSVDEESARDRTVRLLTGDSYKHWAVEEVLENDVTQSLTSCDSSYILTMKANFKWEELYLRLQCPRQSEGSWELNEDNTVITIDYMSPQSGSAMEKKFAIMDLTEELFSYEVVVGNNIKIIKLRAE